MPATSALLRRLTLATLVVWGASVQAAVPVLPGDTEETLSARVLAQEHLLYPTALRHFVTEAALRNPEG